MIITSASTAAEMEKIYVCRTGLEQCEVSQVSKVCSACRFSKCLAVGMKSDLLQVSCPLTHFQLRGVPSNGTVVFVNIPDIGGLYDWGLGSYASDSSWVDSYYNQHHNQQEN